MFFFSSLYLSIKPKFGAIFLNSWHIPLYGKLGHIKSILGLFNAKSIASPVWCSLAFGNATNFFVYSSPFSIIESVYNLFCSSKVLTPLIGTISSFAFILFNAFCSWLFATWSNSIFLYFSLYEINLISFVFNEVNTIPGCTSHSRYPSMLNKIGISFPKVIDKLIKLGLERWKK